MPKVKAIYVENGSRALFNSHLELIERSVPNENERTGDYIEL